MPITIVPTQEWEEKQKKRKLKEAEKQPKKKKAKGGKVLSNGNTYVQDIYK